MWDQTTDRMLLEMRDDAVMLFEYASKKLIYANPTAKRLLGEPKPDSVVSDLPGASVLEALLQKRIPIEKVIPQNVDPSPWFPEPAVLHCVTLEWQGQMVQAVSVDRRSYGPPPEAMQMMKAVLTSAYFTALRIDLTNMCVSVVSDKNTLMNTQAHFPSFTDMIRVYAEALIHPEDREEFLSVLSVEQLRLFLEANTFPACTVRRLSDEEYRWASFTLTAVNPSVVMLFGMDSNEQHLQQERSARYRAELHDLSLRNSYILSSVSDIFRLMLHVDLITGDTIICSMHDELASIFTYDMIYPYEEVAGALLLLVHPDDRAQLEKLSTLESLTAVREEAGKKLSFDYRRINPNADPDLSAKFTRSVLDFVRYDENGMPTEAFYTVQDIDQQRRKEIAAKRMQDSLTNQFFTLIQNRFLWFIDCDYGTETAQCYRITNHMVTAPMECPFGQFFERLIMPHCHPEDYKKAASTLLPSEVAKAYEAGTRQMQVEYRHKCEDGWRHVRAEIYLEKNDLGQLHTMTYIADIEDEVQNIDQLTKSEHEQLILRRKFGMMIEDEFVRIDEVDLDADTIQHYEISEHDFRIVRDPMPFSRFWEEYPLRFIHPDQREQFAETMSYPQLLRAARERKERIKQLFLFDVNENGEYAWCNAAVHFSHDENGKAYLMSYVENVNDEICRRDAHLHALKAAKRELQQHVREEEHKRIRRAHLFLNIASNFQLSLNQIYATLDRMEHEMPVQEPQRNEFRSMFAAYERLSAMTECAKDVLLLENNQLPLLHEPVRLPEMICKLRDSAADVFAEKQIRIVSYSTHVTQETILTDTRRLYYIIDNIFVNILRSLPNGSDTVLQLSQNAIPGRKNQAMYEFSLVMHGDSVSQDIQSGLLSPIPQNDPLKSIEEIFLLHHSDYQQHNLYLSKRLISLMNGSLEFIRLPDQSSAVTLRMPFEYLPQQILFPVRYYFDKRIFVWDSKQPAALATMEMLRETGMQSEWQPDFESTCAYLKLAEKQGHPYTLLLLRQSDLNAHAGETLNTICTLAPQSQILILPDAAPSPHAAASEAFHSRIHNLKVPMFRSVLADALWQIAEGQ